MARKHMDIIDIDDPDFDSEIDDYDEGDGQYDRYDIEDSYDPYDRYDRNGRYDRRRRYVEDDQYDPYDGEDLYDADDRYDQDYDDGRDGPYDYDDDPRERRRGHNRRGGGILYYLIPILLVLVIVVAGCLFLKDFLTYKAASDEYELVKERIVIPDDTQEMAEVDGITYPDLDIDLDALLATNEDFVGVLYIPALELYYPVAHSHDNSEYLTTTFEGTKNPSGCIFLDANASEDFTDNNTFIYGHNMKNETMFGILKEFSAQEGLCASNPYIYLYLKDGSVLKYHIFAYYTTPVDDALYEPFSGDDAYDAYVARAQSRSYYEPSEDEADDFTARPNLLTLSTCWGTDHKNNFVVQSALIGKADVAVEVTEDVEQGTAATAK